MTPLLIWMLLNYNSSKTQRDIFSHKQNSLPATAPFLRLLSGEITDTGGEESGEMLFSFCSSGVLPLLSPPLLSTCALLSSSRSTIIIWPSAVIKLSLFFPSCSSLFTTFFFYPSSDFETILSIQFLCSPTSSPFLLFPPPPLPLLSLPGSALAVFLIMPPTLAPLFPPGSHLPSTHAAHKTPTGRYWSA